MSLLLTYMLTLAVQRITASNNSNNVAATRDQIALRYGPLVYSVEQVDQPDIVQPLASEAVRAIWKPELLGGIMALEGRWRDGTPLHAVPYYTRMNRTGKPAPAFPAADGAFNPEGETAQQDVEAKRRSRVWLNT